MAQSRAVIENIVDLNRSQGEIRSRLDDLQGRPQSLSEVRRLEEIQGELNPVFQGLESAAPAPLRGESPRTYNRRLLSEVATEVDRINRRRASAEGRNSLSPAELRINEYARSGAWYDLSSNAANHFGAEILAAARALVDDPRQGSFTRPGTLREVTSRDSGHRVTEYRGDCGTFLEPFRQQSLCVIGGSLSRPFAELAQAVARQPRMPQYPPPPPSLGPQPALMEMITAAVRGALPQRRSRK